MRLWQHPNGYWYAEFETDKRRSLKTRDGDLAKRLFNQLKRDYLRGKLYVLEHGKNILLKDFAEEMLSYIRANREYSTYRAYRLSLTKLYDHLGNVNLRAISRQDLKQLHTSLLQQGLKKVSINIFIRHLKAAFTKAVEWEYIPKNPYAGIKQFRLEKKLPRFLTKDEIVKLFAAIDEDEFRIMVELYLYTGLRRSELLKLHWQDIEHGFMYIRKTKTHLERARPITDNIEKLLNRLREITTKGNVRLFKWRHERTISKFFERAVKKSGIKKVRLHDLRHTFASHLVMSGEGLKTVQELLGHQQISTTLIYAHLSKDHLKSALSKLDFSNAGKKLKAVK